MSNIMKTLQRAFFNASIKKQSDGHYHVVDSGNKPELIFVSQVGERLIGSNAYGLDVTLENGVLETM